MSEIEIIKKLCEQYGFKFTKALGQNFLVDEDVLNEIVSAAKIDKSTSVIEIGPGMGSLTKILLDAAKDVTAVELDAKLLPVLTERFSGADHFKLIHQDILKFDVDAIIENENTVIVANLPYYITTPVLAYIFEKITKVKKAVLMMQKEVGERIVANPGTKAYGSLSLFANYYSEPSIILNVPSHCFIPQPKIDSVVLEFNINKRLVSCNEQLFFKLVKASFLQRRKIISNAIKNSGFFNIANDDLMNIFETTGIDPKRRGETLSIEDFERLTIEFNKFI